MKIVATNPSRNFEIIGEVEASTEEDVKNAVRKARKAFLSWSALSVSKRRSYIQAFIDISKKRSNELIRLIAMETGRTLDHSRWNVEGGIEYFEAYAELAEKYLAPRVTKETDKGILKIYREPKGVVAAIAPWNFPYMNVVWQCGQALLAGNTIVYKNSIEDVLFSKMLEELMKEAQMPEGVFNILYGNSKLGDILVHEDIDMISFTGSTTTGHYLTRIAAEKFISIVTELGGSTPFVIFEDVEITDKLIDYMIKNRYKNAGQACDALKRLIVHESKFAEIVEKLSKKVATLTVGDALDEKTQVGPMISERQVQLLEAQIADAIEKGGKIEVGGSRPKDLQGGYYLPTVITQVTRDMRIWIEETFGPVLPVVSFKTDEEAIELANDTEFGLTAHIFTHDKKRFERMAQHIKAGSVGQNEQSFRSPHSPFGGYKKSGMGRIHGEFGFDEVTNIKVVAEEK